MSCRIKKTLILETTLVEVHHCCAPCIRERPAKQAAEAQAKQDNRSLV